MKTKDYKPQIDGLRAISVIAVILYHVEFFYNDFKIFSGGFIGVDIFFVISGYLITSLIIKEINETNSFSLINFYKLLDPTNTFNPGIGISSKLKNWK